MALMDDDIQLDVQKFVHEVRKKEEGDVHSVADYNYVHCIHSIQNNAHVMRRGKWAIDRELYGAEFYPQVCTGAGYLIPNRAAAKIFNMAKVTKSFPIDDVFITGILRVKSGIEILPPGVFRSGNETIHVMHEIKECAKIFCVAFF